MTRSALPWLVAGGAAAAIVYLATRRPRARTGADRETGGTTRSLPAPPARDDASDPGVRNASLVYRPIGRTGEPYPDWVRALAGKSGIYVIREIRRDGSTPIVYVGESHTDRLYQTLTRHFQTWRRSKKFWAGQYTGTQSHDPGLTYPRDKVTVAARVMSGDRAIAEEARLIARLRPRDNLMGQPAELAEDEAVPF
jgi:hypothetical protein